MEKLYYESPTVDVVDVRVESGFANSTYSNGGIADYTDGESAEMEPYADNF